MSTHHNNALSTAVLCLGSGALGWIAGGWLGARRSRQDVTPDAVPSTALTEPQPVNASSTLAARNVSWWVVKTPGVILEEMNVARAEIESLGRDIYATFRHPFERELAAAVDRFEQTYGRKPGVGRHATDADFSTVHSWMQPAPSVDDLKHLSYQGRFVYEWGEFEREFGDFWASRSESWTERFWTGVYDRVVEYRKRAADWRQRFVELGGVPTPPAPRSPTESFLDGVGIPWRKLLLIGGGIVAGALIVPPTIRALRRD